MPRRLRSFFFDNINKRLLVNTTKNTKQSKDEKDAGSMTDNDFLKKSEIDSAIDAAVTGLIGGAPGALDTLDELSAALNDDSAFSTTVTNSLANKLESSDLTGYATETYVGQQITAAGSYSNASVDAHLNQSNPTSGYVLSWNGSDYSWIAQPTGFSGAYADLTGTPTIPTNNNQLTNGAGYITGITSSNVTTALGYTPANYDHFRHTGHGHYTSTTTSALLTEALGDDAFDSKLTAHKTGWSYAGNGDLTDAGRLTELAGTSWLWWTDNSTDNVQGTITGLCIAPNTGGSAGKVFIYNDQGSGYSPGWREVWTSASDGAGSGLDADTVDGIQGASFLRSDAGDTQTNSINMNGYFVGGADGHREKGIYGNYNSYRINNIWSMGTAYKVSSAGTGFGNLYGMAYTYHNRVYTSNVMGGYHQMVWCENGTPRCALGRNVWSSGNVTAYSDIRVKENLEIIPNALEKVKKLNGYTFDRTDFETDNEGSTPRTRQAGVVAQEVLEVLPEVVTGNEDNPDGHLSVAYGNMVGLLIEAIKEQQEQIEELKARLQ